MPGGTSRRSSPHSPRGRDGGRPAASGDPDDGAAGPAGASASAEPEGTVPAEARDHAEHAVAGAAAVTDLGRVRAANEDAGDIGDMFSRAGVAAE